MAVKMTFNTTSATVKIVPYILWADTQYEEDRISKLFSMFSYGLQWI